MLLNKLEKAKRLVEEISTYPPPPQIDFVVEKDVDWLRKQLEPLQVNWIQLDNKYYMTNQTNFLNIIAWDWTDTYPFIRNRFDCDKRSVMFSSRIHALSFKSNVNERFLLNQVGIVIDYGSGHAYNLVIFPDGNIMLVEPESDKIFCWTKRLKMFYPLSGAYLLL